MKRIDVCLLAVLALVCGLFTLSAQPAQALDDTWDGGPASSGTDWLTATNWGLDVIPNSLTVAAFNTKNVLNGNPNLPSASAVLGIKFNDSGWHLTGAGTLTIGSSGITSDNVTGINPTFNTIDFNTSLTVNQAWSASGSDNTLVVNGNIANNGNRLRLDGDGNIVLNGIISGTGRLTIVGSGTFAINGDNTYSGTTYIDSGAIYIGHDHAFGSGLLDIDDDNDTPTLIAVGTRTLTNNVRMEGNINIGDGSALTLGGTITVTGGTTINNSNGAGFNITGPVDLAGNSFTHFSDFFSTTAFTTTIDSTSAGATFNTEGVAIVTLASTVTVGATNTITVNVTEGSELRHDGFINGAVNVIEEGFLHGIGTISGALNTSGDAIVAPGNSIGTMTVGSFVHGSGATLQIEFDATSNDLLHATTTGVLNEDSIMVVRQEDTSFIPTGKTITVITTGTSLTNNGVIINPSEDSFSGNLINGSDLGTNLFVETEFNIVNGGKDGTVTFNRIAYAEGAFTPNNAAIAAGIDADAAGGVITGSGENNLTNFLDYDYSGLTEEEALILFNAKLAALSPEMYGAAAETAYRDASNFNRDMLQGNMLGAWNSPAQKAASATGFQFASAMNDPVALNYAIQEQLAAAAPAPGSGGAARPAGASGSGATAATAKPAAKPVTPLTVGNPPAGSAQFFARGGAVFGDRDAATDRVGYNADTVGGLIGLVYSISQNFQAGVAVGFSNSNIDIDGGGNHDMDNIRAGPFATWTNGKLVVEGAASLGLHMVDSTRLTPGGTAVSNFDSFDFSLYAKVGFIFQVAKADVMPFVSVDLAIVSQDSFTETGAAPGFNLSVASNDATFANGILGVKVSRVFQVGRFALVPEGFIGWKHEFGDDNDISATFIGGSTPFTVKSGVGDDDSIVAGAAVTTLISPTVSLFVQWNGEFGGSFQSNAFSGGVRVRF